MLCFQLIRTLSYLFFNSPYFDEYPIYIDAEDMFKYGIEMLATDSLPHTTNPDAETPNTVPSSEPAP